MARPVCQSLALGLGLLAATAAPAQDLVIPDRARLQAMGQEEYAAYREQIQNRVDGMSLAEQNLMRDSSINGRRQMENRAAAAGYGQGYGQGYGARGHQGGGRGGGYGRSGGRGR